jgi:Spy/CpxP family protein refolding chaperone
MDYFNKKRLAFWGVTLLVIMNISALATIWFQRHRPKELLSRPEPQPSGREPRADDRINTFLKQELDLTETQTGKFVSLQREHFRSAKAIHDRIRDLKRELFNELSVSAPDTVKAGRLADEIGAQQRELEKITFYHFLALKRVCTPEQQKKLATLFGELLRMLDPQRRPPPKDLPRPPREG